MKQLSGLDAAFVHQESPKTPMHVSPVLIYGPDADSGESLSLGRVRDVFENKLAVSPVLTQKLFTLPMGVDEPYWIKDKHFDLEEHLSEKAMPAPGNWTQLKTELSRLHAKGLDMKRPLWQGVLLTGLDALEGIPTGSCALILKIHHSAIDGVSLAQLIGALHQPLDSPEGESPEDSHNHPDQFEIWSRIRMKQWTRPLKLVSTVSKLVPAVSRLKELEKPDNLESTTRHSKTRFNSAIQTRRVMGSLSVNLQDLKSIRRFVRRVTLNDIALSVVGGALREYLQSQGELPKTSLICGAPVNLRNRADSGEGNKIATMQVGLATDIADPVERLRAVHQYALMGKARINTLGSGTVMDISESLSPGLIAEGLRAMNFASTRVLEMPVPFHVMVSNVPGPPERIALAGAPLESLLGLGPIRHLMGLFHVVSNSAENYTITFNACRSIMPDADFYEQCLRNSFDELLQAAQSPQQKK